jgi:hypothetical protein
MKTSDARTVPASFMARLIRAHREVSVDRSQRRLDYPSARLRDPPRRNVQLCPDVLLHMLGGQIMTVDPAGRVRKETRAPLTKTPRSQPCSKTPRGSQPPQNEKLVEALAIAERDAAFNADRQWFKSRPDRSFRARLATAQEIEDLHSSGAWPPGWVVDESCFVYAVVKHVAPAGLETLHFVLPPPKREPREDELERMWRNARKGIAEIARRTGQ